MIFAISLIVQTSGVFFQATPKKRILHRLITKPPDKYVAKPTVLPTVGRRAPTKKLGLGALGPTVGNTVGSTTYFLGGSPTKKTHNPPS